MELSFECVISCSVEEVFAFHQIPSYLAVLMEGRPAFRLLHHDGTILSGSTTWFEENMLRCIPVVMGFRHTIYEPPNRFGEELIHGPFVRFIHVHAFSEHAGGTLVRDELDVRLPWIYGGERATRRIVAPQIRSVFEYRHRRLSQLAEDGTMAKAAAAGR